MTEEQRERKRAYDREYSKKHYAEHKEEIKAKNKTDEQKQKNKEYMRRYRERTKLKALAHIRFNAYRPGQYVIDVAEDGQYHISGVGLDAVVWMPLPEPYKENEEENGFD